MGYRMACADTINAARERQRYFRTGAIRTACSDAIHGKSMSLDRENWLRSHLDLPPLRVVHVETAAPRDTRRDVRGRFPAELAEEAREIFGSLTEAVGWAVTNYRRKEDDR